MLVLEVYLILQEILCHTQLQCQVGPCSNPAAKGVTMVQRQASLNLMPWLYENTQPEFAQCCCRLLILERISHFNLIHLLQVKLCTSHVNTPDTSHTPMYNKPIH